MAKIDTSKIDGYDGMTAEEKLAALESYEYDDGTAAYSKLKADFDKTSSDLAALKRNTKQTEAEQAKTVAEKESEVAALREQLDGITKKMTAADYTARYLALGYSDELARDTAQALVDGNVQKVFENQQTFLSERDKAKAAEQMRDMARPSVGAGQKLRTQADIINGIDPNDHVSMAAGIAEMLSNANNNT